MPSWNALKGQDMGLVLTNPQYMKVGPGRKSDARDSEWIRTRCAMGCSRQVTCQAVPTETAGNRAVPKVRDPSPLAGSPGWLRASVSARFEPRVCPETHK